MGELEAVKANLNSSISVPEPASNTAAGASVPFMDLGLIHAEIMDELTAAFARVVSTSAFVGGREVKQFEESLAAYVGVEHTVGVASGTAGLCLALQAGGIDKGDEVIVPANTFVATVEAVVAAGADPVTVDVSEETALMTADGNMDNPDFLIPFLIQRGRQMGMASKILFPIPERGLADRLYRITAETLIVWGESDRLIPPVYGTRFQEQISQSKLVTIKEAGHLVTLEQPERLTEAVCAFVR